MDSNNDYTHSGNSNYLYGSGRPYGNGAYGNAYGAYGNGQYAYGNGQYGNGMYGNGQYGNSQYYGNGQYTNNDQDNDSQEQATSFNPIEWVFTFLHYWYLFVIFLVIALGLAMLKNRKWIPTYMSQGSVIINENRGYGGANSQLMQGFGLDGGYTNVNNQVLMLGSYDLMCRVVDSLPFMQTEYITQGRFKTRNLYRDSPILIEQHRIEAGAYNDLYEINFEEDGSMHILSTSDEHGVDVVAHYGKPVKTGLFEITIWPTELMVNKGKIYVRFRSRESLVDEFMNRVSFNFVSEGSSVLGISLTSETPQRDCEFIDKLSEIYLLKSLEQKNEVAEKSIHFINEQLVELQDALEKSEGAMTNFRQANKFVDVNSYAGQLMGRVASYDEQALAMRLRETYFDYLTNYLSTNIENGAVIAPATLGLNDPMLMTLVQQLNDLRVQRGELTERNVYYAKYTNDIENVKEAINEVVSTMRASLQIEKADLERRYQEVETEIQGLPEKELQMVAIERNYRIDDNYYTFFLQKRAEAEIQKASNTPDNTVLDKARTISVMNASAKNKTMTTYLLIGLLIPLVLIILSELLNNKIRSPKDILKMRMFHLIGSVRHARNQNPTLVRARPKSSYSEMLRSIRTRMEFVVKRKENLLISVSSTESGDGKTFLCSNLAALYSMTGKQTLLIDCDIRKPNIHTKLGLEDGLGLTNYLIGDCELDDIIISDTPFGFDLMRAGTVPPNPGELIHSDKMRDMLTTLRERYPYIVIDTSPIGLVPDAYPLIDQSDICLFVIRCMQTDKGLCRLTLEQVAEVVENPEKIQIVLSDIPTEGRFAYGGYGYGYGYGYGGYGYGYGGYGYGGYGYGKRRKSRFKKNQDDAAKQYYYYHDDEEEEDEGQENGTNTQK